jgi:hypothetical protein
MDSFKKNYYMVLVCLLILLCDCQRIDFEMLILKMVGLARLELATPSLSGTYSNHLSYNPIFNLGS